MKISSIDCGTEHVIILTDDGSMFVIIKFYIKYKIKVLLKLIILIFRFSWGRNRYGQCGIGCCDELYKPTVTPYSILYVFRRFLVNKGKLGASDNDLLWTLSFVFHHRFKWSLALGLGLIRAVRSQWFKRFIRSNKEYISEVSVYSIFFILDRIL